MCEECGCGLSTPPRAQGARVPAVEVPWPSGSGPEAEGERRRIEVQQSLVAHNVERAGRNRAYFRGLQLLVLNLVSAPGSGKTTLLERTAEHLRGRARLGVIVGDLETDHDARRLKAAGIPVVPITTGTVCHLDAGMVGEAMRRLDLAALDVLVIENVGNLVCPAAYDLGEHLRVVLTSVTEGEDKPAKYPPLFHSAHVAAVTKVDLASVVGWNREQALGCLRRIAHHARLFELSAKSGAGMSAWAEYLVQQLSEIRAGREVGMG